jgi:DNA repair protein RadC
MPPAKPKSGMSDAAPAEVPHYLGHRDRLRERFREGADSLPDYELLELVLFAVIPREDVKERAKDILKEFGGDLSALFSASRERLMQISHVGEKTADHIALIGHFVRRASKQQMKERDVLSSWSAVVAYCTSAMAGEKSEQFRILFLDRKNKLLRDEVQNRGTVDHTPVYPREVVKRALELGASAIILVHNHPSGDPTPSSSDVEMTKQIVEAAKTLDIAVHDHLIIGRQSHASLKQLGLM